MNTLDSKDKQHHKHHVPPTQDRLGKSSPSHQVTTLPSTGLTDNQTTYLDKIGLSKEAIRLYKILLSKGKLTAAQAAGFTLDHPSAEYRLFYLLEDRGMVRRRIGTRPMQFEALPLATGLKASLIDTQFELKQLLGKTDKDYKNPEIMQIILGRQALYDVYIRLANSAQKQICIYAIGIAYSKELDKTQRKALMRGVRIRHLVQQYKPSNYHVINKWLRAGVKLRHHQSERGYHVTIIDNKQALITISDPKDTENRVTIYTENHAVVEAFQKQFDELWVSAKPIEC